MVQGSHLGGGGGGGGGGFRPLSYLITFAGSQFTESQAIIAFVESLCMSISLFLTACDQA